MHFFKSDKVLAYLYNDDRIPFKSKGLFSTVNLLEMKCSTYFATNCFKSVKI